jgi:hypothetical protein
MATSSVFNAPQQASFTKGTKINTCCQLYKNDIAKMPYFNELYIALGIVMPKIEVAERVKKANLDTTSITQEKNTRLDALIVKADGLGTLFSSVTDLSDSESETHLQKMVKSKLNSSPQDVALDSISKFTEYLLKVDAAILVKYAITIEELTGMQSECQDIRALLDRKKAVDDQKMSNQSNLDALIDELNTIINSMTAAISRFAETVPKFYADFNKITVVKAKATDDKAAKKAKNDKKEDKTSISDDKPVN